MTKVSTSLTSLLHRLGVGRRARSDAFNGITTPKMGGWALITSPSFTSPTNQIHRGPLRSLILTCLVCLVPLGITTVPALATGDANVASCPQATEESPGFRTSLPDCRAYELVSPAYGAGAIAGPVARESPPLLDGSSVLAESFGAFAGTEELGEVGTQTGAIYDFARGASGWTAEAQAPAGIYGLLEDSYGFSVRRTADPTRSVWLVPAPLAPGEEREQSWVKKNNALYVLREGRGVFSVIGPAVAPGHVVSPEPDFSFVDGVNSEASDEASEVVFTVRPAFAQLWPGDSTVEKPPAQGESEHHGSSLYEYVRGASGEAVGEPVLVGVSNAGVGPWVAGATHRNEGADLLSQCGIDYDGMSADGADVFFTAVHEEGCPGTQPAVNEVYARIGGVRTVKISGPDEAEYAGVSEDGAEVFFVEGGNLFAYDLAAERAVLVGGEVTGGVDVARDGSQVYFTSTAELTNQANGNGEAPAEVAGEKLYAYDTETGVTAFVAAANGVGTTDVSGNGDFFVFEDAAHLKGTDDEAGTVSQVFEYDALTGRVARASEGQQTAGGYYCAQTGLATGFDCDGNTSEGGDVPRLVGGGTSVAGDGTVVFTSVLGLTPSATEGRGENVYEFASGQVYLISAGDEAGSATYQGGGRRLFGIDESGDDVFFSSGDSLVPQDTDTQSSWYDARVDGGFPGPTVSPECAGEACQGAGPSAPALSSPLAPVSVSENVTSSVAQPIPEAKPKPLNRAQKLAKALRGCKKEPRKKRASCEAQAQKKYGARPKSKAGKATTDRRPGR
jgi:hypothetical protein